VSIYRIEYLEGVVASDIPDLPTSMASIIRRAINSRLAVDPVAYGKPLRHSLKSRWRLRVGDWRVVYLVDQTKRVVTITAIRHRKDVYEGR
jgi:mRNA interferase RelE/StbE